MVSNLAPIFAVAGSLAFLSAPSTARSDPLPAEATVVSVVEHGAVPDDGADDAAAVRAAIEACRRVPHPCLYFPPGTYRFQSSAPGAVSFAELSDFPEITVRAERAVIIGTGTKSIFAFQRCGRVSVSGLDVDWDPLPFTAGRVVAVTDDSFDLQIAAPHPLRETAVQAFIAYDGAKRVPLASNDPSYLSITQKAFEKRAQIVGPDRLRIFVSPHPELVRTSKDGRRVPAVGDSILAWYVVRGAGVFRPIECGEVRFERTRIFAAAGMGFACNSCDSVSLRDCEVRIKPGSDRWMSTTVDATHCNMVRNSVEYIGCTFENMGDDAINVHGMYTMVHERPDARTIVLRGWKSIFNTPALMAGSTKEDFAPPPTRRLLAGDPLEFGADTNPLAAGFAATVTEVSDVAVRDVTLKRVRVDRDLPDWVRPGTIVANTAESPRVVIRNCAFRGGRGCSIRLKSRHALVEDCTFEDVFGAGVWITCDSEVDHESISAKDVTIRRNVFRRVNPAISSSAGRKQVFPEVHQGLVIEDNRIESSRGAGVRLRSVKGAVVRGNTFVGAGAEPVFVDLSSDVRIENNHSVSAPPAIP